MLWRRKLKPTPVFLPGKSHGERSLVGYSPWGHQRVRHLTEHACNSVYQSLNCESESCEVTSQSSIQFSHSVMSDPLPPHELQHARPPCLSPTPRVRPNSCPLSQWCHPAISSSVVPFSSCPQSFLASESFQMRQLFTSGGRSIRVSASVRVGAVEINGIFQGASRIHHLFFLPLFHCYLPCGKWLAPVM